MTEINENLVGVDPSQMGAHMKTADIVEKADDEMTQRVVEKEEVCAKPVPVASGEVNLEITEDPEVVSAEEYEVLNSGDNDSAEPSEPSEPSAAPEPEQQEPPSSLF